MPDSKKPKISVIVPIYKCEQYVGKCLDSILSQTFPDFEVICVDDCSPDRSVEIVDSYIRRDPRIKLLRHERNLGLGGARNTAIKAATANYIASVDSDDSIKANMLEMLWNAAENGYYDIVVCGFDRVDENGRVLSTQTTKDMTLVNDGNLDIFGATNPAFWNKLWKKSLYTENEIWFPEHVFYQDTATTPRILAKSKRVRFLSASLYNYLVRPGSASTTASAKHLIDYFKVFDVIIAFLEKEGLTDRYFEETFKYIDRAVAHHAHLGAQSGLTEDEQTQYLRHLLLFKLGYVENWKLVAKKTKPELIDLISKARTKSDLIPPDGYPSLPLSLIVKTFLRPHILERFLISVGRYEERNGFHFSEILVGDDSPPPDINGNARAIQKAKELFPTLNIRHLIFEENIGLSDGRNRLVQAAREDFVLLCDDDFILDEDADIRGALNIAKQGTYQLVGGWLKNKFNLKTGEYAYWGAYGCLTETQDELIININERPIAPGELKESEYLLNFYVADRACLLANPWDETLKVEEHQEFFYRFKKNGYKAALYGSLFVKHTADRTDNPPRYNEYRFSKKTWESYLFAATQRMGKQRRTINRRRATDFERWIVDARQRTSIQNLVPLREPVLAQLVSVERISPEHEQCFGGYYDVRLVSTDGRYVLCQTAPALDRLPGANDRSDILLIDLHNGKQAKKIGETTAWCHQQGSHAQFMYGSKTRVIYNAYDNATRELGSIAYDVETGTEQRFPWPISALSPDGRHAASLNFARLFRYRPGYGYAQPLDPHQDENAPASDGLWLTNLETGEKQLVVSYDRAQKLLLDEGFEQEAQEKLVFNHVAFNTDGSKLLLLLRIFSKDAPFPTFTLVCNRDGSRLRRVFGFCSHYHWKDRDTLVLSGSEGMSRKTAYPIRVYELNTETGAFKQIDAGDELVGDGHCSYSPDRNYLLYDSYATSEFPYQRLVLHRLIDGKTVDLGYFYSPPKWYGNNSDLRCDLHPRWSPDGKLITFDSIHEGVRATYAIRTEEAIKALESELFRFSRLDLQKWYQSKYSEPTSNSEAKEGSKKSPIKPGTSRGRGKEDAIERFLRKQRKLLRDPKAFFRDSHIPILRPLHLLWKDRG